MRSRLPLAAPLGWAPPGAILLLSVHTKCHYTIDGYASAPVIAAIPAALRGHATIGTRAAISA